MNHTPIHKDTARSYTWGKNCESFVLADVPGLSVKQERMPPHTREQLHYHEQAQQFFYVLKGEAGFYIDGEKVIVTQQQGIYIAPKAKHFIENNSSGDLEFLVISQPATGTDRINLE